MIMKALLVLGALGVGAAAVGLQQVGKPSVECAPAEDSDSGKTDKFQVISVDSVAQLIAGSGPKPFIFDANSVESYREGHVPSAKWIAFDKVTAQALPPDKKAMLVFYCFNELCRASHIAGNAAAALGYTNVHVMTAGIRGWKKANKPVEGG
jgi:rhodanese-related sulfurtransferase